MFENLQNPVRSIETKGKIKIGGTGNVGRDMGAIGSFVVEQCFDFGEFFVAEFSANAFVHVRFLEVAGEIIVSQGQIDIAAIRFFHV